VGGRDGVGVGLLLEGVREGGIPTFCDVFV
jgi:hypothetical protein